MLGEDPAESSATSGMDVGDVTSTAAVRQKLGSRGRVFDKQVAMLVDKCLEMGDKYPGAAQGHEGVASEAALKVLEGFRGTLEEKIRTGSRATVETLVKKARRAERKASSLEKC